MFLSIVLGIWLLEHLYVGWRLLGLPLLAGPVARRGALAVLVLGFLSYPLGRILARTSWQGTAFLVEYVGALWMGTLFLLLAALLVIDVVTLGGFAWRSGAPWMRTGAATLALVAAAWAWFAGTCPPRVVEVEVPMAGLPAALDGTTVVQISDVHLGDLVTTRCLDRIVAETKALEPDLVMVTGDLLDGDWHRVDDIQGRLRRLRAPMGVYSVTGNHEYYAGVERCIALFKDAGFIYLENQNVEAAPGLWIAGVPDDRGARQTGHAPADLPAALHGIPDGSAVILLQHSPDKGTDQTAAEAGVDLMLDGHTHGGQIWPFHYLVALQYPHLSGVYQVGAMTQVVSQGAGRWGPPMRLFAPSDIVRVTLRCAAPHE